MANTADQDQRYSEAAAAFGPALERLARGYEANADKRRDLVQDIHFALWRSLSAFDGRCSLRTWVYRVAHNTATSHILKERRQRGGGWIGLEDDWPSDDPGIEDALHEQQALARLTALIQRLQPQDRQIMLLYLENVDASGIADITGLKPPNVATKIHRIKALLSRQFHQGGRP